MHAHSWIVMIPLLATGATTLALFFAVFVAGPIARALFGVPVGFGEHFTSEDGYHQAWLVQVFSAGFVFLLLGIGLGRIIGRTRFSWAVWAANPGTVGIGFVIFKLAYERLPLSRHLIEYYNIRDGVLLSLLAPVVFASCCRAGAYLFNLRFRETETQR